MSSLLFVRLLPPLFLWKILIMLIAAQTQSDCNFSCQMTNGHAEVGICLFSTRHMKVFERCCTKCEWFNFYNDSLGESFLWDHQSQPYGEYNCINLNDNNVIQRVLIIPLNMSDNCSDCLSITACTAHTSHDLYLYGSLLFNEQILDGTPCTAYNNNNHVFLDDGPQLLQNVSINNLSSIYIQCQLCGSHFMLTYYLPRSVGSCHSLPQPTTTFSVISTSGHSQLSTFGYSSTASHNDSVIPVTTTLMSTTSQTHTPNTSSSLPTIPAESIAPGESDGNTRLSPGAVAGIVFGILIFIVIILILVIIICYYWKKKRDSASPRQDSSLHLNVQIPNGNHPAK